jgi:polyadenylate-binding protein
MRAKLHDWFNGFGPIVSILVKIDVERKAPFAFVSFNLHQHAKEA